MGYLPSDNEFNYQHFKNFFPKNDHDLFLTIVIIWSIAGVFFYQKFLYLYILGWILVSFQYIIPIETYKKITEKNNFQDSVEENCPLENDIEDCQIYNNYCFSEEKHPNVNNYASAIIIEDVEFIFSASKKIIDHDNKIQKSILKKGSKVIIPNGTKFNIHTESNPFIIEIRNGVNNESSFLTHSEYQSNTNIEPELMRKEQKIALPRDKKCFKLLPGLQYTFEINGQPINPRVVDPRTSIACDDEPFISELVNSVDAYLWR